MFYSPKQHPPVQQTNPALQQYEAGLPQQTGGSQLGPVSSQNEVLSQIVVHEQFSNLTPKRADSCLASNLPLGANSPADNAPWKLLLT
jgi:hypothetical protein